MFSVLIKVERKCWSALAFQLGGWPPCFERPEEKHVAVISPPNRAHTHLESTTHPPAHTQPRRFPKVLDLPQIHGSAATHRHRHTRPACVLCTTTSGALGKEEAGSRLEPLEQLMSTRTGSRINSSSSGSPAPGCQISWETYSSPFTTWQAIKRWGGTIKPLEKKTTTSRRLLSKQHIWPMHWCQRPSRKESTWSQATEITSQCFSTLIY